MILPEAQCSSQSRAGQIIPPCAAEVSLEILRAAIRGKSGDARQYVYNSVELSGYSRVYAPVVILPSRSAPHAVNPKNNVLEHEQSKTLYLRSMIHLFDVLRCVWKWLTRGPRLVTFGTGN